MVVYGHALQPQRVNAALFTATKREPTQKEAVKKKTTKRMKKAKYTHAVKIDVRTASLLWFCTTRATIAKRHLARESLLRVLKRHYVCRFMRPKGIRRTTFECTRSSIINMSVWQSPALLCLKLTLGISELEFECKYSISRPHTAV